MRLQRITSRGRIIPELDGLRFLAIFAVLIVHVAGETTYGSHGLRTEDVNQNVPAFTFHLEWAVPLFFVISGLILARAYIAGLRGPEGGISLHSFYRRRITRLEPPYILSLVLFGVSRFFVQHDPLPSVSLAVLKSLFYVHNFFPSGTPLSGVTWSLEVEIEFYLLTPLMAQVFRIQNSRVRRGVLAGAVLLAGIIPHAWADNFGFFLIRSLVFFWAGFLLADFQVLDAPVSSWGWDVASLLAWGCVLSLPPHGSLILLAVPLMAAIACSMKSRWARAVLSAKWIAILGGMCYSLYLTHMLVLALVSRLIHPLLSIHHRVRSYALAFAFELPLVVGAGLLYYIAVERPCMDPQWPGKLMHVFRRAVKNRYQDVELKPLIEG